jgi:hypothetical protein
MQRILKYPLLFNDLCRQTPACDDPVAHAELEKMLYRLEETAKRINGATNNVELRKRIQTTWLLEDRLEIDIHVSRANIPMLSADFSGHPHAVHKPWLWIYPTMRRPSRHIYVLREDSWTVHDLHSLSNHSRPRCHWLNIGTVSCSGRHSAPQGIGGRR